MSRAAASSRRAPGSGPLDFREARQVAPKSRGLRRLLPALPPSQSDEHLVRRRSALDPSPPSVDLACRSVKVSGGYLYVARPGDTLWRSHRGCSQVGSEATGCRAGAAVARAQLVAGDGSRCPEPGRERTGNRASRPSAQSWPAMQQMSFGGQDASTGVGHAAAGSALRSVRALPWCGATEDRVVDSAKWNRWGDPASSRVHFVHAPVHDRRAGEPGCAVGRQRSPAESPSTVRR